MTSHFCKFFCVYLRSRGILHYQKNGDLSDNNIYCQRGPCSSANVVLVLVCIISVQYQYTYQLQSVKRCTYRNACAFNICHQIKLELILKASQNSSDVDALSLPGLFVFFCFLQIQFDTPSYPLFTDPGADGQKCQLVSLPLCGPHGSDGLKRSHKTQCTFHRVSLASVSLKQCGQ